MGSSLVPGHVTLLLLPAFLFLELFFLLAFQGCDPSCSCYILPLSFVFLLLFWFPRSVALTRFVPQYRPLVFLRKISFVPVLFSAAKAKARKTYQT